jgi:hypothetical protein
MYFYSFIGFVLISIAVLKLGFATQSFIAMLAAILVLFAAYEYLSNLLEEGI